MNTVYLTTGPGGTVHDDSSTVLGSEGKDSLTGSGGSDWFFARLTAVADKMPGKLPAEILDVI